VALSVEQRFWAKVDRRGDDECWPWLGVLHGGGYGRFFLGPVGQREVYAHRFSYELAVDAIPEGMQIDHLCRNTRCVNPAHMEVVTQQENLRRGTGASALNAAKNECKNGHPFDLFNTYFDANGWRHCRACMKEREQKYRAKRAIS
jgi:hypothetical protein